MNVKISQIFKEALVDFAGSKINRHIKYILWMFENSRVQTGLLDKNNQKYAVIYFYENKFEKSKYNGLLRKLKRQSYKNYSVFVENGDFTDLLDEICREGFTYICFIEQGDLIADHSLASISCALEKKPETELIYTDEDVISSIGVRYDPYFKPQFAPFLLWSHNYMNAFLCLKLENAMIFRLKDIKTISQDSLYKFLLEITRDKLNIHRIPDVLYHRSYNNQKKLEKASTKSVVEPELKRRGLNAEFQDNYHKDGFNFIKIKPTGTPKLSIIIPFKDRADILKICVNSIESKSTYKNYEIILVNNRSQDPETLKYLKNARHKVLNADIDFNFSKLNNMAADVAEGEYLLLLNNDVEVISPDWIESSLGLVQIDQVGAVGGKLLYPNNRIQHVGMIKRRNSGLCHAYLKSRSNSAGYKNYNNLIKEYMCITGACLMVSKAKYMEVGGLNEDLVVCCNDSDFCFKLMEAGYYNLYNPYCVLYHHESLSRKGKYHSSIAYEMDYQKLTWAQYLQDDPFYNVNFSGRNYD